jgi:hypothetical protein
MTHAHESDTDLVQQREVEYLECVDRSEGHAVAVKAFLAARS